MSKAPGLLSRLMGRSNHPVVSSLATATLNRPLLAHPAMAESIIGGYLSGKITSADTQLQATFVVAGSGLNGAGLLEAVPMDGQEPEPKPETDTEARIGVINISGGLVNRPMPGASGAGPCSYVAIRNAFDAMLEDDSVSAIVLRIESPGGMASGCFDLADHIYESRGRKPLHALVDDYAYSGGFALAAPCDEVWISRTGGIGSVGACWFHQDWSEANGKMGRKVTAIYSGERKIDGSPDFPLSDEAKGEAQEQMHSLRTMFVDSIARYRGLDADAVSATEARCYRGQAGIDVGFATRLGTWHDLMAHLNAPAVDDPAQPGDDDAGGAGASTTALPASNDDAPAVVTDAGAAGAAAAAVEGGGALVSVVETTEHARSVAIDTIVSAKLPAAVALAMIETTPDDGGDVDARVASARQVIDLCTTAKAPDRAADFIRSNTDIAQVRVALVDGKADQDEKVTLKTALPKDPNAAANGGRSLYDSAYSQHRAAAAANGS